MPNVLHLINTAGPGGAETVLDTIVRNLPADRWTSSVVVRNEGWLPNRLREFGIEPVLLGSRTRADVSYYAALRRLIRDRRIDLVHSHYFGPTVTAGVLKLTCGVAAVGTLHGTGDLAEAERFLRLKLAVIRRGVDRLVFVSAPLRAHFLPRLGVSHERTAVIANGVEDTFFERAPSGALRPELAIGSGAFLIGAVGNLRPAKGYDILLRAMRDAGSDVPDVHLIIAGEGEGGLREELQELSRRLEISDRVHFLGFRADVREIMADLDLFVVSSRTEGFSLVTVQAMAAGVPIVATRSGGPEMILEDGQTGLLVDAGSAAALAAGIRRAASERPRMRAMAERARVRARDRFTVQHQVSAYETVYAEALAERADVRGAA